MRGWCECIEPGPYVPPKGVVGIVVAKKFPDEELIREKLSEGIRRLGDSVVWVLRTKPQENDAVSVAWDVLQQAGIEPLLAAPLKCFEDGRGYADNELLRLCERLIVFHDAGSSITKYFKDHPYTVAKVFVIERGKKKRPARKGRKPAGV